MQQNRTFYFVSTCKRTTGKKRQQTWTFFLNFIFLQHLTGLTVNQSIVPVSLVRGKKNKHSVTHKKREEAEETLAAVSADDYV